MKTLLLITHSSAAVGGGEDDFLRLLKFLNGKFIIYAVFPEGERVKEIAELSDKYLIIPNRPYPGNFFRLKPMLAYLYFNLKKIFILFPFLRKNRKNIDLSFINSSVCILEIRLLKFLKIPYVISVKEKINPGFVRNYVYKLIDKSTSKVIVISDFLKQLLSKYINNNIINIIRTSIDENIYKTLKSKVTAGKSTDKFVLLNIGQIYDTKNQLLLIEAINKLKIKHSILVKFIGFVADHKYKKKLIEKVNEYNLQDSVEFCGALNKREIIKEYLNSNAVVITSREEGMSLVLVEALYFEKPVISTNVGIIPEVLVNYENGIILKEADSDLLSVAIDNLINDKLLYMKIQSNALKTFYINFNLEKALEEHLKIFNECLIKDTR